MVYWVGNHYTDGSLDYGVSCGHVHPTRSQATHKSFCTTACGSLVTGSHMHPLVSLTSQTLSVPQRCSLSVLAHGERVQRLRTTSREWVGHVWSTQIMYIHRLHLLDSCQCYLPSYLCSLSDDWGDISDKRRSMDLPKYNRFPHYQWEVTWTPLAKFTLLLLHSSSHLNLQPLWEHLKLTDRL